MRRRELFKLFGGLPLFGLFGKRRKLPPKLVNMGWPLSLVAGNFPQGRWVKVNMQFWAMFPGGNEAYVDDVFVWPGEDRDSVLMMVTDD